MIGEAPIPEGTVYIAADRSGRWLLGAAYHQNCVWVILVSDDGRFLYCCERKRGTVAAFVIDQASGALSPNQTVEVGSIPRSLAADPSGRFLASAIQGEGVIHIHAVSPQDGRLTHCATQATGGTPIWVEFVAMRPPPAAGA